MWFHGVIVRTLDPVSSDLSYNRGGTFIPPFFFISKNLFAIVDLRENNYTCSDDVMVSTLDFESSDPSSNLGGTLFRFF